MQAKDGSNFQEIWVNYHDVYMHVKNILKVELHACNKDMQLKHMHDGDLGWKKEKGKSAADIFLQIYQFLHTIYNDECFQSFSVSLQLNNGIYYMKNLVTDFSTT